MNLKSYQITALNWFEDFLKRCKDLESPGIAYEETTREWCGNALQYHPLPAMPQVPYVCLRVPTGGGKTLIAGMAIERVNRSFLFTQNSLTIWLVPSETIREQTLKALRDPETILHKAVFSALRDVTVLDVDEALRVTPAVLNGSNVVIVATMQAFKREDMDILNVYKTNSQMVPHFEGISGHEQSVGKSMVDALKLRHPFIVVDEAHNQGHDLAFETLARLGPSVILELTATPDRQGHPSNVLFSVSASALEAEDMIKMPIDLIRREDWKDALRDALACLNKLQNKATAEEHSGGGYLRPIMLLQADRHSAEHETIIPEVVKKSLIEDFGIPEDEIAIATGQTDDFSGINVLSPDCRIRFVITIDKLREGWDCPFAYILCSFRNTSSSVAAEQILGRILRMPGVKKKVDPELNKAYAFITSTNFLETVEALKEGLVRSGFDPLEADKMMHPVDAGMPDLFQHKTSVTFSMPEAVQPKDIPAVVSAQVIVCPETGTMTLQGVFSKKKVEALTQILKTSEARKIVEEKISELGGPAATPPLSPSENGEVFRVPVLAVKQGDLWEPFEETHLLQSDWKILNYSCELSESEFQPLVKAAQGGRFLIRDEYVQFDPIANIEVELALFDFQSGWDQVQLVSWLERNVLDQNIPPDEKAAFFNKAVASLIQQRGFSLEELVYSKFRLRSALEKKVGEAKSQAMQGVYVVLLGKPDGFISDGACEMVFQAGCYAFDQPFRGWIHLPKHFFAEIGNLKQPGEEFECAYFIATGLDGVKYWVRNVERKPGAFSLQTGTDRFYPDFICKLIDGRVLVVEYKGADRWDSSDSIEKRQIGELWEKRSNGKGLFIMPKGLDFESIRRKIAK